MCAATKQGGSVMIAGEQIEWSGRMTWGVSDRSRGGAGGPPPLVLDQTEAQRAEKNFFWDCPPPVISGSDDRALPLPEGLNPPLGVL